MPCPRAETEYLQGELCKKAEQDGEKEDDDSAVERVDSEYWFGYFEVGLAAGWSWG
jgi:hypothetical protein